MATLLIMALKEESQMVFENNGVTPHYCGVGQVKAAFMTQKLILEHKPTRVINLGTAGSHNFKQGRLVECTSFIQRPPHDFFKLTSKQLSVEPVTQLTQAVCGTGDFVEKGQPLVHCDIMDMEAYAMAFVCQKLDIPFTSIKFVSDYSDQNLANNWLMSLKEASGKLFDEYKKLPSH